MEENTVEVTKIKEELIEKFIPTATYSGKQITHIINQFNFRTAVNAKPISIKKGDVIRVRSASKVRPACVIKVAKDRTIFYIHMTSTDNIHCMTPIKSRFFGNGCLTKSFDICTEEYAIENFIGVMDDTKAVNQAIKDLKALINDNL